MGGGVLMSEVSLYGMQATALREVAIRQEYKDTSLIRISAPLAP